MKKEIKRTVTWSKKRRVSVALLAILGSVLLMTGCIYGVGLARYYNGAANQASLLQIRELIILAIDGLKKDVPIDAKTGDLYFPESKLYLQNPRTQYKFTYAWYPADSVADEQLSVSIAQPPGINELYRARNQEELFAAVPKIQSCSRGVNVSYEKLTQNTDPASNLKHTVNLQNGKKVYLYLEESCSELNKVAELLKNLKSY